MGSRNIHNLYIINDMAEKSNILNKKELKSLNFSLVGDLEEKFIE